MGSLNFYRDNFFRPPDLSNHVSVPDAGRAETANLESYSESERSKAFTASPARTKQEVADLIQRILSGKKSELRSSRRELVETFVSTYALLTNRVNLNLG